MSIASIKLFSQGFVVPEDFEYVSTGDYSRQNATIIKCVNWLENTPANEQTHKRKKANGYLMKWLSGSSEVNIEVNEAVVTFVNSSPDLMMIFFGGWAKYSLESGTNDKLQGNLAGLEAVISFYSKNREYLKRDKHIEKLQRLQTKGTLTEFLSKRI